jgi:hypothetical protein
MISPQFALGYWDDPLDWATAPRLLGLYGHSPPILGLYGHSPPILGHWPLDFLVDKVVAPGPNSLTAAGI